MKHPVLFVLLLCVLAEPCQARWRELYVVDARLSALRSAPSLTAPLLKRLRVGRRIFAIQWRRDGDGRLWARVAVTRRTRGWILADAAAGPGRPDDERRLMARLERTTGVGRAEVARVAADRFPALRRVALAALQEEADAAAAELARRAARRLGSLEGLSPDAVRALMLSDPGLDRYNRLGITFDVDVASRRYVARRVE